ncbi:MAG: NAD(P)-binding domain-containing protein, partial [Planctomycetes bacterium]|nr:NAD(P)-binding domain-containing protein [Planctomycetota bacterium]
MRILILGAGAMGTALAGIMSRHGQVRLWCREEELHKTLVEERENRIFLPGYRLPEAVDVFSGKAVDLAQFDLLVLAIPTQYMRPTLAELGMSDFRGPVVSIAKGLELGSFLTPCQVLEDIGFAESTICALSGPSHAEEVCRDLPTSVVIAGDDAVLLEKILPFFCGPGFRPYYCEDRLGVGLGGALKNIIALAAGISDRLGFGLNAKASLLNRGLAEIR